MRSQRAIRSRALLRAQAGSTRGDHPLRPSGLERRPSTWPGFPWASLRRTRMPSCRWSIRAVAFQVFDATYGYVTRALSLLRANTADPDVPIHVAGRCRRPSSAPDELAGFLGRGGDDACETIGVSLYDWTTTPPVPGEALSRRSRTRSRPSRSRSRVSSRCSGITLTSASTGMKLVSPTSAGRRARGRSPRCLRRRCVRGSTRD